MRPQNSHLVRAIRDTVFLTSLFVFLDPCLSKECGSNRKCTVTLDKEAVCGRLMVNVYDNSNIIPLNSNYGYNIP